MLERSLLNEIKLLTLVNFTLSNTRLIDECRLNEFQIENQSPRCSMFDLIYLSSHAHESHCKYSFIFTPHNKHTLSLIFVDVAGFKQSFVRIILWKQCGSFEGSRQQFEWARSQNRNDNRKVHVGLSNDSDFVFRISKGRQINHLINI